MIIVAQVVTAHSSDTPQRGDRAISPSEISLTIADPSTFRH
ncbi:MAG: hypothetical protein R3B48_10175 [Kofleriaceae bacterium]